MTHQLCKSNPTQVVTSWTVLRWDFDNKYVCKETRNFSKVCNANRWCTMLKAVYFKCHVISIHTLYSTKAVRRWFLKGLFYFVFCAHILSSWWRQSLFYILSGEMYVSETSEEFIGVFDNILHLLDHGLLNWLASLCNREMEELAMRWKDMEEKVREINTCLTYFNNFLWHFREELCQLVPHHPQSWVLGQCGAGGLGDYWSRCTS